MSDEPVENERRHAYEVDPSGFARWPEPCAAAWGGLLRVHRRLVRDLEADLERRHGLSLSALDLLSGLAVSPRRRRRLSALAEEAGLSLSRVSRIVDALEARGLVTRRPCPADARAIDAVLTREGLEAACRAQATHFEGIQRRFFDRLSPEEVDFLAAILARVAPAERCDPARDAAAGEPTSGQMRAEGRARP